MSDNDPPLARDLSGIEASHAWKPGAGRDRADAAGGSPAENGELPEADQLRAQVSSLTDALEDVVALALSGAEYKDRAIMMHRRAVAALSGVPVLRTGDSSPDQPR